MAEEKNGFTNIGGVYSGICSGGGGLTYSGTGVTEEKNGFTNIRGVYRNMSRK